MVYGMVYGMAWYGMAWHGMVYGMVWCGMVWNDMVWYGIWYGIWYGMVIYDLWYCMIQVYGMGQHGMVQVYSMT